MLEFPKQHFWSSLFIVISNGHLILIASRTDCFTIFWVEAPVHMVLPLHIQGRSQHSGVTSIDTFHQLLGHIHVSLPWSKTDFTVALNMQSDLCCSWQLLGPLFSHFVASYPSWSLSSVSPCSTSVVILKNSVSPDRFYQSRIQDDVKKFYGWIDQRQQRHQILTSQQICCYQSLPKYLHSKNKKIIQKFIAKYLNEYNQMRDKNS